MRSSGPISEIDLRVLVLAPTGRDAEVLCDRMRDAGMAALPCRDMQRLCDEMRRGAGAAILAAEALTPEVLDLLTTSLRTQPPWSDFPLIVMTSGGAADHTTWQIIEAIEELAHATLLERPVRSLTLISAVKVAIQSRRRQYQVREYLIERGRAELALLTRTQLAALRGDIALHLAKSDPLPEILQHVCEAIVRHLQVAFARIWAFDASTQTLRLEASAGMYTHLDGAHAEIPLGAYKIGRIAASQAPFLTNDVQNDENISDPDWAREEGMIAFVGYPLVVEGHIVGVLAMFARRELSGVVFDELRPLADGIAQCIVRKRTEVALRHTERQTRLLLDSTAEAIYGLDTDGRCTFCNSACVKLLGYQSASELIGRNMHDLMHYAHADGTPYRREECQITRAIDKGQGIHVDDEVLWRADGSQFAAEYWSFPIRDENGIVGAVVTFVDITKRKEAERKLRMRNKALRAINRINITIAGELSLDKVVQEVTDAGRELSGAQFGAFFYNSYEDGEAYMLYCLSGAPADQFSHLPMPRKTKIFAPTFNGGDAVRLDDVTKDPRFGKNAPYFGLPDKHLPVCSYLAVPVVSGRGEVIGGLFFGHEEPGVFDDYAEQIVRGIAAQAAVAIDNARLFESAQRELTERRRIEEQLRAARVAAEAANASKSQFLANMSHEIRTPMTAILGYADILLRNLRDPDNAECVRTIKRNGDYLIELINDILDISKIEAGKLVAQPEKFRLGELVNDIHKLMQVRAREKLLPLEIHYEGLLPETIRSDSVRLRQILVNLIGNAIKFTEQGRVVVKVSLSSEHKERLRFDVIDTGIGIADHVRDRLFQPFTQADLSDTRRYSGTGLGLAISRRLARMLGGDIEVQSEVRKGTTFSLTIATGSLADVPMVDLAQAAPSAIEQQPDAPDNSSLRCRVLVVDDRRDIRYLAQHFLEEAGGAVEVAENGEQAIEKILKRNNSEPYDVVVMDMQMPVMDGYEATRKLRAEGFQRPIIALTAGAMQGDRERCLQAGCDDYTSKPIDGTRLVQLVAHYQAANTGPTEN